MCYNQPAFTDIIIWSLNYGKLWNALVNKVGTHPLDSKVERHTHCQGAVDIAVFIEEI